MQRELHDLRLQKRFWEQQAAAGTVVLGEGGLSSSIGSHLQHGDHNNDSIDSQGSAPLVLLPEHTPETAAAAPRVLREESSSESTTSSSVHPPPQLLESSASTSAAAGSHPKAGLAATSSSSSKSADPMADYVPYAPFAAPAYVAVREQWCRTLLHVLSLRERCSHTSKMGRGIIVEKWHEIVYRFYAL